ncbi:YARHG domain-containing protein [Pontibacter sp. G13]|uniref:YARHG domain-containing protein n=1 Tax=Pontibacter sp. G13 TaxID=3074898 RepID=UPI00288C4119|nr:YARHG domain-containing protein [Pontibacter sp. G13]WNJ19041.1 YARHG domain-containing protein [Pontibacter sp. G13]
MNMKFLAQLLVILTLSLSTLKANDGAFFMSGNQLIPVSETQVSVQKEVLKVERIHGDYLKVTVDYVFYNPGEAKRILVGFEAASPVGDVSHTPKNGRHPYMENFLVQMNDQTLRYQVDMVNTNTYYVNGSIQDQRELIEQELAETDYPDYFYVYHFYANFQSGENRVHHEYEFRLSNSIDLVYNFNYILTAANRWANKQIDDFTLIVDMGDFTSFNIAETFFQGPSNWKGVRKFVEGEKIPYATQNYGIMGVVVGDQPLEFKMKNFSPEGELKVYLLRNFEFVSGEVAFDFNAFELPYNWVNFQYLLHTKDDDSYKILRNLPYARRGYIFKTPVIQQYYERMEWYVPNPDYEAKLDDLEESELKWLKALKANHS